MTALILVDIQNDFLQGGSLEVPDGNAIIPVVNQLQDYFDLIVATQDWHPSDHLSFASNHENKKPFDVVSLENMEQVLWPDHCVQGSEGAEFPQDLDAHRVEAIFRKGMIRTIDSYSGFYDNGHLKQTGLAGYLRDRGVDHVVICGLAADFCVFYTILDALKEGFQTTLVEDATRPIDENTFNEIKQTLREKGVEVVSSERISPVR